MWIYPAQVSIRITLLRFPCSHHATLRSWKVWSNTYDLERVGNNADSHELLAAVATVHHEGVGQALDDGALRLAEALGGIAASSVRKVDGVTDLDVVAVCAIPSQPNVLLQIVIDIRMPLRGVR